MRIPLAIAALALMAVPVLAQAAATAPAFSPAFGVGGTPRFTAYYIPEDMASAHGAGEPTIGIPYNTDHVFFQAFAATHRAVFDEADLDATGAAAVAWTDVSPQFTPINVDPMIHADPVTGRIFAGGLAGPCSLMGISDDDGLSWTPAGNMCSGAQFDHQSIGSGPWSPTAPDTLLRRAAYPRAVYYCAQLAATACATSLDGGRAWLPFTEVVGPCGGLHGHISVSEVTGMAAVPHGGCAGPEGTLPTDPGSYVGFAYTKDNGATWQARTMPEAQDGDGFDPDLVFSKESGWMWLAQADDLGVHVALTKDDGATWETLGASTPGAAPAQWLNLTGTFQDPVTGHPLVYTVFPDLEAGDDERVALAFMGTTDPAGEHPFDLCSEDNGDETGPEDLNVWHYYLSQSFDAGQTWATTRLSEDPVQVGAIWNGGGGDPCRNLLDFHDMDIDSRGRLHIALSDGCTGACAEDFANATKGAGQRPVGEDSRDSWGAILRQSTGRGLFAAADVPGSAGGPAQPADDADGGQESPGLPVLAGVLVVVVAAALRRR